MARYVTVRLTLAQAQAASNASDLIAEQLRADGNKHEAAIYERAGAALDHGILGPTISTRKGRR